jgi:hypothetical protein
MPRAVLIVLALVLVAGLTTQHDLVRSSVIPPLLAADLQRINVGLLRPEGQPKVSRERAAEIGGRSFGDSDFEPRAASLAEVTLRGGVEYDGLVWVVSLDPEGRQLGSGGPPPGRRSVTDWLYVVINAESGEFLWSHSIGHLLDEPAPAIR